MPPFASGVLAYAQFDMMRLFLNMYAGFARCSIAELAMNNEHSGVDHNSQFVSMGDIPKTDGLRFLAPCFELCFAQAPAAGFPGPWMLRKSGRVARG